jgi:hypothetical protein
MRMRRPSPAVVMALAALVFSASGSATAGVLITTADIRDETIRSADIRDGTIASGDVHDGALSGVDVAQDSVTDADVRESSLGNVADAARLDGKNASQFVRRAETFTRHFSCSGTAFENSFSAVAYTLDVASKQGDGGGQPLFRCSVDIPDGAKVTSVSFAVHDTDDSQDIRCSMWRTDMTIVIGDETSMANDLMTTGTPADARLTDTTIEQPVIDNGRFSYFLQCRVGDDEATGLYGATVTYRVTGGSNGTTGQDQGVRGRSTGSSSTVMSTRSLKKASRSLIAVL